MLTFIIYKCYNMLKRFFFAFIDKITIPYIIMFKGDKIIKSLINRKGSTNGMTNLQIIFFKYLMKCHIHI